MTKNIFQFKLILLIIASIPLLCITGPFLPDLVVSISALIFLFYLIYTKNTSYLKNNFFLVFMIFYLILIISSLLSEYHQSLKTSFSYIRFGLLVLLIIFLNDKYKNFSYLSLKILLLIFFSLTIDSIIQKIIGFNLFGWIPPYGRITSFFGDDIKLGGFVSRLIPLILSLMIFHDFKKIWIFTVLLLGILMCVISGERISILMIMICAFLFVLVTNMKWINKFYIILSPILCVILIVFFSETSKFRLFTVTLSQLNFTGEQAYVKNEYIGENHVVIHRDSTMFPRIYHMYYETAFKIWKDNIFFGSGPRTYKFNSNDKRYLTISDHEGVANSMKIHNAPLKNLSKKDLVLLENQFGIRLKNSYHGYIGISGANSHPHNLYLQTLAEVGLVGTIFVFFIFLYCLFLLFSNISIAKKLILIGIIMNLFPVMFSGNFFNNWLCILYFFPIGFLFLSKKAS